MKSMVVVLAAIVVGSVSFGGCATIFKGSESSVYFLNGPDDLQVYSEGERLSLERKEAKELYGFSDSFRDEVGETRTTYYAPGIMFPKSNREYQLELRSGSRRAQVTLEPRMAMRWFWLDLFTGGIIVDAITGDWNELSDKNGDMNIVDVSKYLK
jgi:hypothetical protein